VRSTAPEAKASYFLGVRLTPEEVRLLDAYEATVGVPNRSEALRRLLRSASGARPETVPALPVSLRAELEEIVEDGWAESVDGALTLVVHLGLKELSAIHARDAPALRTAARQAAGRRDGRRRADREGRGLLGR
jgi:hypothetical protein